MIHDLRVAGFPIASDDTGYWLAEDRRDLEGTLNHLRGRIAGMASVIRAMEETMTREFPRRENGGLFA